MVTAWFRPPELFLGATNYGPEIDMWSLGCIIPSLCTMLPLFPGDSAQQQLEFISNTCGSITPDTLPGVQKLSYYTKMNLPTGIERNLKQYLQEAFIRDEGVLDLVDSLLILDPSLRLSAPQALLHVAIRGTNYMTPLGANVMTSLQSL